MKENNGVFLITFIVIILFIVLGIMGIKYLNLGVNNNKEEYAVVAKDFIEADDLDVWKRKDNRFIIYRNDSCGIVDINSNVIVDIKYDECSITSNGYLVSNDNENFILNSEAEIVLETEYDVETIYDSYSEEDYYLVIDGKEKKIYDIEANNIYNVLTNEEFSVYGDYIVFEDSVTNYESGDSFKIDNYYGSGKYLIFDLYKSNGYKVYDFNSNKETKYTSLIENDYSMTFSNENETLIIDYKGNVIEDAKIRKLNDNFSLDYSTCEYGFNVLDKDSNLVNDKCYSLINEDTLKYGYLYLYDEEDEVWNAIYSDYTVNVFDDEADVFGEFVLTWDEEKNYLVRYDRNGDRKEHLCINSFYEVGNDKYVCADLFNYYLVDNEMNKLTEEYEGILCNDDSACIFRDSTGKYGLMINEEVIIEPSYYKGYVNENYVIFEVVGGYEIITLAVTDNALEKDELVYEFSIDYGDLSTENVIKEYSLEEIEDIIYENEDLFKEYSYIVLTNERVNGYRREILLMFDVIVDNKEYLNKEYFFLGLDRLQIDKTDSLEGSLYAGYYDEYEKKIELLVDDLNVINHELLHFIDSNMNYDLNSLMYECDDEYYYLIDMKDFDKDKVATCELQYFDYGNFMSEVGTEVNSARYTDSKITAYSKGTIVYHGLVYLLGEKFMEDVYFAQDGEMQLYKKLSKYLTFEEYKSFINAVNAITNLETVECMNEYIVLFNTFDKLYSSIIGGNWYEDNEYKMILSLLNNQFDIREYIDSEDANNLLNVADVLNEMILGIDSSYSIATTNIGMYMLDGKTYLDLSVWNNDEIVDLRIGYDFEISTIISSEVIQ